MDAAPVKLVWPAGAARPAGQRQRDGIRQARHGRAAFGVCTAHHSLVHATSSLWRGPRGDAACSSAQTLVFDRGVCACLCVLACAWTHASVAMGVVAMGVVAMGVVAMGDGRWGWWRQVLSSLGLVYRATDKAPCFYPTQAPRAVGGWGGVGLTWPQTATAPLVDGRPLTGQSSSGAAASPRPMRAEARRAERV